MTEIFMSHLPAQFIMKGTRIKKPTFFQRVILRNIDYIALFGGERLYSVKDWNKKCPDYRITIE